VESPVPHKFGRRDYEYRRVERTRMRPTSTAARDAVTVHLGDWTVRGIDEPFAGTKFQASRPKL